MKPYDAFAYHDHSFNPFDWFFGGILEFLITHPLWFVAIIAAGYIIIPYIQDAPHRKHKKEMALADKDWAAFRDSCRK